MIHILALLAVLFLPIICGGYAPATVTGRARWRSGERDFGPVAGYRFALLEVTSENPPSFRHGKQSPHARTDAQGRFTFRGVPDGRYVLAIEFHPPFNWHPMMYEGVLYLVIVEGQSVEMGTVRMYLGVESVEMGTVRVGIAHLWAEGE